MHSRAILCVTCLSAFVGRGAEYSRVVCDVSTLPFEKRFVAEMLVSRIEARTARPDAMRPLTVRFAPDDAVKGENAVKADCTAKAAKEVGAIYVDAGPLGDQEENMALGLFEHKGVARHPGDLGYASPRRSHPGRFLDRFAIVAPLHRDVPLPDWGSRDVSAIKGRAQSR